MITCYYFLRIFIFTTLLLMGMSRLILKMSQNQLMSKVHVHFAEEEFSP